MYIYPLYCRKNLRVILKRISIHLIDIIYLEFQCGRGSIDLIFTPCHIFREIKKENKKFFMIFIDFRSSIPWIVLFHGSLLKRYHSSDSVNVTIGMKQAYVMAFVLSIFYIPIILLFFLTIVISVQNLLSERAWMVNSTSLMLLLLHLSFFFFFFNI